MTSTNGTDNPILSHFDFVFALPVKGKAALVLLEPEEYGTSRELRFGYYYLTELNDVVFLICDGSEEKTFSTLDGMYITNPKLRNVFIESTSDSEPLGHHQKACNGLLGQDLMEYAMRLEAHNADFLSGEFCWDWLLSAEKIEKLRKPVKLQDATETISIQDFRFTIKDGQIEGVEKITETSKALNIEATPVPDNFETSYRQLLQDCLNGEVIENPRTEVKCYTKLNHTFTLKPDEFPILTSRKINWKGAIAEMLAYMRGYQDLEEFHSLGVKTWDANCKNWKPTKPNLKDSETDCGVIYGASANAVGFGYSHILEILKDPEKRYDRGIIWNFWNPAYFEMGCLRPCLMMHHFNVVGDTLHLTSYQRSMDVPLGGAWNLIQAWFLLHVTAKLTRLKQGTVTLHVANAHIYENQVEGVEELLGRKPLENAARFHSIETLNALDVTQHISKENISEFFDVQGYQSLDPISFPFTV